MNMWDIPVKQKIAHLLPLTMTFPTHYSKRFVTTIRKRVPCDAYFPRNDAQHTPSILPVTILTKSRLHHKSSESVNAAEMLMNNAATAGSKSEAGLKSEDTADE